MQNPNEKRNSTSTKSKKQLAAEYNICVATLNTWIKRAEIELRPGARILTPAEVQKCYDVFGEP